MFPLAICSGQQEETPGKEMVPLLVCGPAEMEREEPVLGGLGCRHKYRGLGDLTTELCFLTVLGTRRLNQDVSRDGYF